MKEYKGQVFAGERALFGEKDARIVDCVFDDGESPLKEGEDLSLQNSMFRWKYPLWYCKNVSAEDCTWLENARAGVWYTENIAVRNAVIAAPKNFRRSRGIRLENVTFSNAAETLWTCRDVQLKNVSVSRGDYFLMNCENVEIENLDLDGNYSLDGAKNVVIRRSRLLTKDAFWNSENVTVYDSFITGEYLGWNSKNLTLIGCTIESLQGMCYIDRLRLVDCKLLNTTLAFEYSDVEAHILSGVNSVFNPKRGKIETERIGELILEESEIDPRATMIVCPDVEKRSDLPEWKR